MSETLVELCQHNVWANQRLFETCAGLSDSQLDATLNGTFGSIRGALMHIAGAQERIAGTLAESGAVSLRRDQAPFPGFAARQDAMRKSGESLVEFAATAHAGATVSTTWRGEVYTLPVWMLLAQAIHHATEHRTQIATILTQQGVEPPTLDIWAYHEDRFKGDWSQLWAW